MDKGRVVEVALHDELVAQGERYASLWESWRTGVIASYG
jgi:ABC-type multidrug transport system fused ATPase/permease subunit